MIVKLKLRMSADKRLFKKVNQIKSQYDT